MPALPANPETVYVPPIYNKERPLIPKYRIISGLLSVLIVGLLLCGGAGYYLQATGKLNALGKVAGYVRPPNVQPTVGPALPDPPVPTAKDQGPAYGVIPSATTTLNIDAANNIARDNQTVFRPGQSFYVAFSVHPNKDGRVSAKWYTNRVFFTQTSDNNTIKANENKSAILGPVSYPQPTEGAVELYWNGQLAQRLYFVVR